MGAVFSDQIIEAIASTLLQVQDDFMPEGIPVGNTPGEYITHIEHDDNRNRIIIRTKDNLWVLRADRLNQTVSISETYFYADEVKKRHQDYLRLKGQRDMVRKVAGHMGQDPDEAETAWLTEFCNPYEVETWQIWKTDGYASARERGLVKGR